MSSYHGRSARQQRIEENQSFELSDAEKRCVKRVLIEGDSDSEEETLSPTSVFSDSELSGEEVIETTPRDESKAERVTSPRERAKARISHSFHNLATSPPKILRFSPKVETPSSKTNVSSPKGEKSSKVTSPRAIMKKTRSGFFGLSPPRESGRRLTSSSSMPWALAVPKRCSSFLLLNSVSKKRKGDIYTWFTQQEEAGNIEFDRTTMISGELVPGIRSTLVDEGAIPKLIQMSLDKQITLYPKLYLKDIKLGDLIARGAGGVVYKGTWDNKDVAIKICGKLGMFYGNELEFLFEVAVMTLIDHPNIMKCYGANESGEEPFIITPYCEKGTLETLLYSTKLPLLTKLHLAIQTGEALCFLHRCGLMHRDIKPANILVNADFGVSLIDFGVSRIHDEKRPMTMNIGTTAWIAPELLSGDGTYTQAIDVYSFALILYELVTRSAPFKDFKGFEIPIKVLEGLRPEIPEGSCPEELGELIQQCWQGNPKKRPSLESACETLRNIRSTCLWSNPQVQIVQGNFAQASEFPHPWFIDFTVCTSEKFVWIASVNGMIAIYKFSSGEDLECEDEADIVKDKSLSMIVTNHWEVNDTIVDIIFVEYSGHVWLVLKSGKITIHNQEGVHIFDIDTGNIISCVALIDHQSQRPGSTSPVNRIWCGQVIGEGKYFISIWNACNGFEVCRTNLPTSSSVVTCIVQYHSFVLVACLQKVFAYKLTPKFVSSWRICDEASIESIHIVDCDTHNFWIVLGNSNVIKIWDCSLRPTTVVLTDPDISITHRGRVNCTKQVKYKPQNLQTVWSLVSQDLETHSIIIRNSSSMSILQEIRLSDNKGGTSLSVLDDFVLVSTSSEQTQSSSILCFRFDL